MNSTAGLARPTSTDHRAWLWVTTILSIAYTLAIFIARLFGKYGLLWYDDAVLGLAYTVAAARWAVQMHAMRYGLGTQGSFDAEAEQSLAVKAFTAHVLLIAALYLSKLSIILFCRKVFSGDLRHERTVFAICYSVVTITGVASLLDVAAGCRPANFLLGDGDRVCSNNTTRVALLCVLDVLSEVAIAAIPISFLSGLQMQRSKKRAVYYVFVLRFGVIAVGISQAVVYIRSFPLPASSSGLALVPTFILQELWLTYSLISATIPVMRSFLSSFHTPLITGYGDYTPKNSDHASRSIALSSMKRSVRSKKPSQQIYQGDGNGYGVEIRHGAASVAGDRVSEASFGSEAMIIRADTRIKVESIDQHAGEGGLEQTSVTL